jgi:probable HAF family extracellular repeat protein
MSRNTFGKIVSSMALWAGISLAAQRPSTFTSFDFPGATSTTAWGINADGAVVGAYVDSAGKQHGFLLSGGDFTTIDYPGALSTTLGLSTHRATSRVTTSTSPVCQVAAPVDISCGKGSL